MRTYTLETSVWLPRAREEVFTFFGDAGNLDRITPPWLHFQVTTPRPIPMHPGALIDYRLRWHGVPLRWRTEIAAWKPPARFVDRQLGGPYRLWVHEHTFVADRGGTLVSDRVEYALPAARWPPSSTDSSSVRTCAGSSSSAGRRSRTCSPRRRVEARLGAPVALVFSPGLVDHRRWSKAPVGMGRGQAKELVV